MHAAMITFRFVFVGDTTAVAQRACLQLAKTLGVRVAGEGG